MNNIDLKRILEDYQTLKKENQSLKEENKILNTRLENSEKARLSALSYYRDSQLMLEINSRLTAQTGQNDLNINLALTTLAGYLNADHAIIFEKEKDKYKNRNTSFKYCRKHDNQMEAFFQNFDISLELPGVINLIEQDKMTEIENLTFSTEGGTKVDIERIAVAPISMYKNVRYILCVFNHQRDSHLLKYVTSFFGDALDRMEKEEIIRQMSITDKFTGLYDRDYFTETCNELPKELLSSLGVVEIDANRLKYINDTYGHDVGDNYIKNIASIILSAFPDDAAFRIGGDEFVVICKNKPKEQIELAINNIRENIKNLVLRYKDGVISDLSASIGLAYTTEKIDIDRLYKEADEDMYQDKRKFYEEKNIAMR